MLKVYEWTYCSNALEHLKSSGTKGFMNGPIACNALEHFGVFRH